MRAGPVSTKPNNTKILLFFFCLLIFFYLAQKYFLRFNNKNQTFSI